MASYRSTYNASPVLTMPPHSAHQNGPFARPAFGHHSSSWTSQPAIANTCSVAGRKRSRDEAAVNLDPPEKVVEAPIIHEDSDEDEWVYGPGMVLMKRNGGYVADASSQSGTWVEERAAQENARKTEAAQLAQDQLAQERPSLRSHKSQRLESSTAVPLSVAATAAAASIDAAGGRASPARELATPGATTTSSDAPESQPVVDAFTLHLGIGWSRISDDPLIQAAARGWARYIENHFPVNNPQIRLESRGLQSYLVEAAEGFFLFGEDLRQGRLVSADAERVLQNLKTSPPTFDGENVLYAAESPKPVTDSMTETTSTATATNDMDMS